MPGNSSCWWSTPGLSPLEAIQAGTEGSALAVNGEGQFGVIAPGMAADVLVVEQRPGG